MAHADVATSSTRMGHGCRSPAMASHYRYSVHFDDGRRVTTNYVGDVL
jgi:hypothetical protein